MLDSFCGRLAAFKLSIISSQRGVYLGTVGIGGRLIETCNMHLIEADAVF